MRTDWSIGVFDHPPEFDKVIILKFGDPQETWQLPNDPDLGTAEQQAERYRERFAAFIQAVVDKADDDTSWAGLGPL